MPGFAKYEMIIGEMARLFMHILYLAKSIFKSYAHTLTHTPANTHSHT